MKSAFNTFPRQKLSFRSKTKVWRKSHLDWADDNSTISSVSLRKKVRNKKRNIEFFNGKVHKDDLKLTLNPSELDDFYIPSAIQHYPIIVPRLNVLVGEEKARRFDWRVTIINPTAISSIENNKRKEIQSKLEQLLTLQYSDEEIEAELAKFGDYINFEWQDIREKRANLLLKHFIKELDVEDKLSDGFMDALIHGEESYLCDIKHNNPIFEKLNPLKTYVIRAGNSDRFEDADLIITDDYWSPGKVIDTYYDQLRSKDVDYIQGKGISTGGANNLDGDMFKEDIDDQAGLEYARSLMVDDHLDLMSDLHSNFATKSNYFDNDGNIRVLRVFWKSLKQIVKVTYYDEQGDEQVKFRGEDYVVRPELGETMEKYWVSQWWQGTKIGQEVYVDMKPRPIQYNKIGNPGFNSPGIVGQIYNLNDQKVVSLLDRAKPFNILYDAAWHRLLEAYSKWFGPLLEIDKAKFAEGWDITKTLYFAKKAGVIVIDSFKEGTRGNSTGKLAGAVGNTSGKIYNPNMGDYIQQNINMMEYAKTQMDEILGIPKQRLGAVENRETVGGVEHAIRQSNYVTEAYFKKHDNVKRRALQLLLETAKIAMRGNEMKLMYIADDMTNQVMNIEGDEFMEEDHGLAISNDSDYAKLEQNLEQLAHAALQNQTLSFGTIMKIFTSPSLVEVQRLVEKDEKQTQERQAKSAEDQNKQAVAAQQAKDAVEQEGLRLEELNITERSRIEELKLIVNSQDKSLDRAVGENESDDKGEDNSLDVEKLNLDKKKQTDAVTLKIKELSDKMTMHKDNLVVKKKQANKPAASPAR